MYRAIASSVNHMITAIQQSLKMSVNQDYHFFKLIHQLSKGTNPVCGSGLHQLEDFDLKFFTTEWFKMYKNRDGCEVEFSGTHVQQA